LSVAKLTTAELKPWLEKETGSVLSPVQAKAQGHRDQARAALQNLSEASKMLLDNSQKEIEKRNMKVYNRARALNKLAALFVERIKKIKIPDQVSYDNLNDFSVETQKAVAVTEVDIKNWFPRISPFFIMDRRRFLTVYEKTKLTINSLTDFVNKEYVKSKTLEKTFQLISEVQMLQQQSKEVETAKSRLQNERSLLEREVVELELQASQIKGKTTLEQMEKLEKETEALNNELKQRLSHLQKPFLKMQALETYGGGGGITPDELKMISSYMENPFEAIAADGPGCAMLKEILQKLMSLLAEEKLTLKPDKQRKAEQTTFEILNSDTLSNLQNMSKEVYAQKNKLLLSPELEEAKRSVSFFERQRETLKTRMSNIETDEHLKETQRQELLLRTIGLKKTIEANVLSFMGKSIQVQ